MADRRDEAGAALQAILTFLAREATALRQDYAATCAQPVAERVARGVALGPLGPLGRDGKGRLQLLVDVDDSRFREGDPGYLGPSATGEAAIGRGLPVRYVAHDAPTGVLTVEIEAGVDATSLLSGDQPLYLDTRKVDLAGLYGDAARVALGGSTVSLLVAALLLGGRSSVDSRRAATLEMIAGGLGLNTSQRRAFALQAASPLALVQGPPGTGKTRVLGAVVASLAAESQRVLVCALTHRAVNQALVSCAVQAGDGVELVKLGDQLQAEGLPVRVQLATRLDELTGRARTRPLILGTTIARVPGLVRSGVMFDVVVIDEAGQLTPPQALCGAIAGSRAILFGDHQQLPPIVLANHPNDEWGLAHSVFERLHAAHPTALLTITYRLNAELVRFPSQAYYAGRLRASTASAAARLPIEAPADHPLAPLLDPSAPLIWAEVGHHLQRPPTATEADIAAACVCLSLEAGLPPDHLAVISPYRAQNQAIRARLRAAANAGVVGADAVVVDTVERMQGQERELVIVSLALSDTVALERQADFFHLPNRLNVAITRARTKCIVLASPTLLNAVSPHAAVLRGTTALRRLRGLSRSVRVSVGPGPSFKVSEVDPTASR